MTCRAIFKELIKYSKMPSEEKEWLQIAESFERKWNFSHCAGAYSARHIAIDKPCTDEDKYRNYKDFHSAIAIAVVNASYEFIYYEFGFYGGSKTHDVYTGNSFFETMIEDTMNLPKHSPLAGTDVSMPYIFVSDVYYLIENLMRTYSSENLSLEEKVFNYRLCRAKRVADNAFGVLYERFGVIHQNIYIGEEDVDQVVMACFALHNFLVKTNEDYISSESLDAEDETNLSFKTASWRLEQREGMSWDDTHPLLPVLRLPEEFHDARGQPVRGNFTKYFSNEAKLPFQDVMVNVVPELKSVN